ncbi:MAG: Type 1 glutamine amidotransferase-like domain-containing protein [Candidatus Shapirobacteria bacterium]
MKLFLTSTGLSPQVAPFFLKLISKPPKQFKVAFIPTAADPYDDKWFMEKDIQTLSDFGFPVNIVDLKADITFIRSQLEKSQIIFVGGGNTFYLLHWIRQSGVDKYLSQLLEDRYYIGASAGSVLAGPDIAISGWDPSWDTNDVKLQDTTGLNLVPFAVSPHYTEKHKEILAIKSREVNYKVIPITDTQAVYFNNDKYIIIN